MILAALAFVMHLSPWSGANLPTAAATAARYRLTVSGKPGTVVHLRTRNVATGWIAAFCNDRVCSPTRVNQEIPSSGTAVLQFELIREQDSAPHASGAVIESETGQRLRVPEARS